MEEEIYLLRIVDSKENLEKAIVDDVMDEDGLYGQSYGSSHGITLGGGGYMGDKDLAAHIPQIGQKINMEWEEDGVYICYDVIDIHHSILPIGDKYHGDSMPIVYVTRNDRVSDLIKGAITDVKLESFEEWKGVGLNRGYNERTKRILSKSSDHIERSWYNKGRREVWWKNFKFGKYKDEK
jgi:hypothetical protein